jgi:hypothetical protein
MTWVDEVMPERGYIDTGDADYPEETYVFMDPRLSEAMRERLETMEVDGTTCEAITSEGDICGKGVGFVLHEDDDYPARSGLHWNWVTVIEIKDPDLGSRVLVVCEECSPHGIYPVQTPQESHAQS